MCGTVSSWIHFARDAPLVTAASDGGMVRNELKSAYDTSFCTTGFKKGDLSHFAQAVTQLRKVHHLPHFARSLSINSHIGQIPGSGSQQC